MNHRTDEEHPTLEFFRVLVEHVSDWIWQINKNGEFVYSNSIVEDILGYSPEEINGKSMFLFIKEEEKKQVAEIINESLAQNRTLHNMDFTMIHRDGFEVFIETNGKPVLNEDGVGIGYRGIHRDITAWKKNQDQKQQLLDIIEASPDFIATADSLGNTTYLNPSARDFLGLQEETLDDNSTLIPLWKSNQDQKIGANIALEKGIWKGETVLSNSYGKEIPMSQTIVSHKTDQQNIHFFSTIARDISDRKAYESIIKHQALYDTLTELPNRRYLHKKIAELIDGRAKKDSFALLFIDIDNFKQINDTLGHHYGDIALKLISSRIKGAVREHDFLCRLGGDEFILLVDGCYELDDLNNYAQRLIDIFKHPFRMDQHICMITCSIGISIYPEHGSDEKSLMRKADKIMYETKRNGKNGYSISEE
ncbi:bifunctional diguanylate cyclase/phosphodiesterase [Bacillus sp. B1-b2]|uniref:sensor domain-containing protein n=1 Tax=Bacillus sp. B1-b2 TaxID=2653201 RepID=UPI00186973DB|nr:diguanylate cyclase [Bacillus sp. B1-b2]